MISKGQLIFITHNKILCLGALGGQAIWVVGDSVDKRVYQRQSGINVVYKLTEKLLINSSLYKRF